MHDAQADHERSRERARNGFESFVPFTDEERASDCVSHLFELQVARSPDATALSTPRGSTTYAQLNAQADRIASHIAARSTQGGMRVGLMMDNGEAMIASVLGALKANVPFVPIDPTSAPTARAAFVLDDSEVSVVLTTPTHLSYARDAAGERTIIDVDGLADTSSDEALPIPVDAPHDDVAWIIYTSGSTGEPKGVVQTRRNVVHFVTTEADAYGISSDDRVAVAFSSSVNFWYRETLSALVKGATIHPVKLSEVGFGGLERALVDNRITLVTLVPSLFRQFAPGLSSPLPDLRLLKVGGEPVLRSDFELYRKKLDHGCVFLNRFGTTETAPVRYHFLDHHSQVFDTFVPIGYPVPGSDIAIMDPEGVEVSAGETGEIVVRSRYLALNYWHRPEITAATFRPAQDDPSERLYFTGDVGRKRPDGCVVHLGRKDNQVQVHGYRIELAEIEMRLRDHADVVDAAAAALSDEAGDTRLIGYVVAGRDTPAVAALRTHLAESLPPYMVPHHWVFLQELPRAPNGKIYRKALPIPTGLDSDDPSSDFVPPASTMEILIATHWRRALRDAERIGVHDNFFDLGGESLGAMQAIVAIEAETGIEISPLDMGRQTLGQIARSCEERQRRVSVPSRGPRSWIRRLLSRLASHKAPQ